VFKVTGYQMYLVQLNGRNFLFACTLRRQLPFAIVKAFMVATNFLTSNVFIAIPDSTV